MDRSNFSKIIPVEIQNLNKILLIAQRKSPTYDFLHPLIGNAIISMSDLLSYLEEKHPYITGFDEEIYINRQAAIHRVFFSELHIVTEEGLRKVIDDYKFTVRINKKEQAESIINSLRLKVSNNSIIESEVKKILQMAGKSPTFYDYLNTVLKNVNSLSSTYVADCRTYFDALSIIRNKVSHSDMKLSESEKTKLIAGNFKNVISASGELQMAFQGYKLLILDVIRFFDTIYSKLKK